jgi:hypothetical protein
LVERREMEGGEDVHYKHILEVLTKIKERLKGLKSKVSVILRELE